MKPRKPHARTSRVPAETYRSLVQQALFGIYRCSIEEDRFLVVNPALAKMLGYGSVDELLGVQLSRDIFLKPSQEEFLRTISQMDSYAGIELQWLRRDGHTVMVRVSGRAIRDDRGKIVGHEGIAEDLTQHRRLEQQLRWSHKMDAVGRLAAGIAHDFNNLLGVILGNAELLEGLVPPGDPANVKIHEIEKAARRGAALTRQLLAFSRKQAFEPRVLDLNAIVREMAQTLHRVLMEPIALTTALQPDLWPVIGDRAHLEQVVLNLAENARDAMAGDGGFMIRTENITLGSQSPAWNSTMAPGDYVMLTISDTGSGMNSEIQAHIFEPFFTTKEVGKGTGLGLATVYGIVEHTGGHIWVDSRPGKGSTFKIYFPRAAHEGAA